MMMNELRDSSVFHTPQTTTYDHNIHNMMSITGGVAVRLASHPRSIMASMDLSTFYVTFNSELKMSAHFNHKYTTQKLQESCEYIQLNKFKGYN